MELRADMKIQSILTLAGGSLVTLLWSGAALAEEYTSGYGPLNVFDGPGFISTPLWIKIWLVLLILTFLIGLVVFAWRKPIARWAGGGFLVSAVAGPPVFAMLGLPMLSGSISIMHVVCWTPALVLLLVKRPFLDPEEGRWYRLWSVIMTVFILFSFFFDIPEALVYIRHFSS